MDIISYVSSTAESAAKELYCKTCNEAISLHCITKDEKHRGHVYEQMDKVLVRFTQDVVLSMKQMEGQLKTIDEGLAQLDECRDKISHQQAAVETDIDDTIKQLQETLEVRRIELIKELDRLAQAKLKSLATQREQMETIQAQLSRCLHSLTENFKPGSQDKLVLLMKSNIVKQAEELTTTFEPDILMPSTEADMMFSKLADIFAECQNYGKVSTGK